jgi:hypothetical protein
LCIAILYRVHTLIRVKLSAVSSSSASSCIYSCIYSCRMTRLGPCVGSDGRLAVVDDVTTGAVYIIIHHMIQYSIM